MIKHVQLGSQQAKTCKNNVIHCRVYYHGEAESACDLIVVIVPLLDLRLTGSKVGADEADASGVEKQANGHTSFIACGSTHSRFYSIDSNIPEKAFYENLLP